MLIAINSCNFSKISTPSMKLYVVSNQLFKKIFDTEKELNEYINNNHNMIWISTIEYYKYLAGRSDVIVKYENNQRPILKIVLDEIKYAVYNPEKSIEERKFIWESIDGTLEEEYSAFRDKGIIFKDDIYARAYKDVKSIEKYVQKIKTKSKLKVYSNIN